jgi:hypothetical protein
MFWRDKKYICEGVNYLNDVKINGKNMNQTKEELFKYLKKGGKTFTKKNIDSLSKEEGFDIWEAYIWIDIEFYKKCFFPKRTVSNVKRWLGVKSNIPDKENIYKIIADYIYPVKFYSQETIKGLSDEVGIDILETSDWQDYSFITLEFTEPMVKIEYFEKSRFQLS